MRTRLHPHLVRLGTAAALAAAGCGLHAASASAADVPAPVPSTVTRLSEGLSETPEPLGDAAGAVVDTVEPLLGGSGSTDENEPPPADESAPTQTRGSAGQAAPASASDPERAPAPPPGPPRRAGAPPGWGGGEPPAGPVCVRGPGPPARGFAVDREAAGVDLSSPLVEQFPQAFTTCPEGAVPAGEETVVAVDAVLDALVGACVRVTRSVAPLQTTLVVLDHNLIVELTNAGLPLEQLVVPCPGPEVEETTTPAPAPSAGATPARASSEDGAPETSQAASAAPAVTSRLAFTGANPGPLLALGSGLLAVGAVLSRRARALAADGA